MPLELDHVYTFSDRNLPEVGYLQTHGLTVNEGRTHPGQGTANRCVMFEENYFELIYLTSVEEARANPLRLDRRADWQASGASPFGLALRGELSAKDRAQFWRYDPPYAPGVKIWIHRANETRPELPMIFVMEFPNNPPLTELKPRVKLKGQSVLQHGLGSTRIESAIAFGPSVSWPLVEKVEGLQFQPAPRPHLHLHIDGSKKTNFALSETVSFAVS